MTPEHYVWAAEGKPVSVFIPAETLREISARLSDEREAGGFLLGRGHESGGVWNIVVEGIAFAPCVHARGIPWSLTGQDLEAFAGQLSALHKRESVVGWFRTHQRPGLFLDQRDFALFRDFFPHPSMIALAMRSDGETGCFIWERGHLHRTRPYTTFHVPLATMPPEQRPTTLPWLLGVPGTVAACLLAAGIFAGSSAAPGSAPPKRTVIVASQIAQAPEAESLEPPPPPFLEAAMETPSPAKPARKRSRRKPKAPVVQLARTPREKPQPVLVASVEGPRVPALRPPAGMEAPQERIPQPPPPTATVEAPKPSVVLRAAGSIPGLGFLKRPRRPAAPTHQVRPARLDTDSPVSVKVTIAPDGNVRTAELVTETPNAPTAYSVIAAARAWRFLPSQERERTTVITFQRDY